MGVERHPGVIGSLIPSCPDATISSAIEREALGALLGAERHVSAGSLIIRPGDRPSHSTFLVSGFCARYSLTVAGDRQFTEISVPGDFIDLHSLLMKQMDHGIMALSDCVVAPAQHGDLRRLTERHPHLTRLLWLETVIDGAIHRQWLAAMGAPERRQPSGAPDLRALSAARGGGTSRGSSLTVPLTQTDLGDILGLTPVHVNRVMMELRHKGLIEWKGAQVVIRDWDQLATFAEFDPIYLRLGRDPV